jgi:Protein of unknown function (DUF3551)
MTMLRAVGFAVVFIMTLGATAERANAAIIYPWCANYSGRGMAGAQNCGFVSFNQCLATVRGVGGTCGPNPFYSPYPSPRYAPPVRQRW